MAKKKSPAPAPEGPTPSGGEPVQQFTEKVEILCKYDDLVPVSSLKPNPDNPLDHPDDQIALLAKLIRFHGWRWPIVVSKESGLICAGHGRFEAAKCMGMEAVPIVFQSFKNYESELAFLLADNKIAQKAIVNIQRVKDAILKVDTGILGDGNIDVTGYIEKEIEELMENDGKPGKNAKSGTGGPRIVVCPECGMEFSPSD